MDYLFGWRPNDQRAPFQMLQLVPMLARFTAEAPGMRLNAGVLLLPLMSPLHLAEEFATLDVMSGGKIILGVGLGYAVHEFKAFGIPRSRRVSLTVECVADEVVRATKVQATPSPWGQDFVPVRVFRVLDTVRECPS